MMRFRFLILVVVLACAACSSETQFSGWQTETFDLTEITDSSTKTFVLANSSNDKEQHIRAIAFDRGSNAAGHFRIDTIEVGNMVVEPDDIIIPPGSALSVTVTYTPKNLETTKASYGGWITGEDERWIPSHPDKVKEEEEADEAYAIHRSIIQAVYDHPKEGIFYIQLVGEAEEGPDGEDESGGGFASCEPGDGVACYTGGFAIDIPQLVPGGPQLLELTGPVRMNISGGSVKMYMDEFPFAIMYLRSEEVPQLPSGVTATLIINGSEGVEAEGTFDGSRVTLSGVSFRIRAALGEITSEQIRSGISALVDFDVPELEITTISPLSQGEITMHMETSLPENPSGNELFDQFLSGAEIIAIMEGNLEY
jgi:hypothetical protein